MVDFVAREPRRATGARITQYTPAATWRTWSYQAAVAWTGLASVYSFAAITFLSRDLARAAEVVLVLTVIAYARPILRDEPNRWLYALLLVFGLWTLVVDQWLTPLPGAAEDPAEHARAYLHQFLFVLGGWWLAGREDRARTLLGLGALSAFATIFVRTPTSEWVEILASGRQDFSLLNAQHTAVVFGSVLIGLMAYAPSFWRRRSSHTLRLGAIGLWLAGTGLTLTILRAAEARQAWLAIALASVIALLLLVRMPPWQRLRPTRYEGSTILTAGMLLTAIVVWLNPLAGSVERTTGEWHEVIDYLNTDGGTPERSSTTIRLQQWRFAVEAIAERPLSGYGGDTARILIQRSELPGYIRAGHGHVHNSYLELPLAYGLPALLVWLTLLSVLAASVARAWRERRISRETAFFATTWLTFFLVINAFESYVNYHTGYYLLFVAGGAVYGATLNRRQGP